MLALSAISLIAASLAGARPIDRSNTQSLGAVYTLSNLASGNGIIASTINPDGTLKFSRLIQTGGVGGVSAVDPPAAVHPDPLFSQHPIVVTGNHVLAVDPGSDTLSQFAISRHDPTDLRLVSNVSTGAFPVSIAASQDGTTACALGSANAGSIKCFAVSRQGLTAIKESDVTSLGLNQTNPPTGPALTVSDILFDNQNNLVVSVKGTPTAPGHLAVFSTKKSDQGFHTLADVKNPTIVLADKGALPFGMSTSFDGNSLFVTDAAVGVTTFAFNGAKNSNSNSNSSAASTMAFPIQGQGATCWSASSPATKSFFSTDLNADLLTEFSFDGKTGNATMLKSYPLDKTLATSDMIVGSTKKGDFLYILGSNQTSILTFSVGTKPGNLKSIQQLNFSDNGLKVNANMAGTAVYVKRQ